jgi:hypothetical protein
MSRFLDPNQVLSRPGIAAKKRYDAASITPMTASAPSSALSYEARRLVLWLADLDVHAFLGDLAGDTWKVDLSDRLGPLVV